MVDQLNLKNQVCFPVYTLAKEIINHYRPLLDELDLNYSQYLVLMVLWENEEQTVGQIGETSVKATVSIGQLGDGGFGLAAELHANTRGVTLEEAQSFIEQAHKVCPYSNATRGNMEVKLSVSNQ